MSSEDKEKTRAASYGDNNAGKTRSEKVNHDDGRERRRKDGTAIVFNTSTRPRFIQNIYILYLRLRERKRTRPLEIMRFGRCTALWAHALSRRNTVQRFETKGPAQTVVTSAIIVTHYTVTYYISCADDARRTSSEREHTTGRQITRPRVRLKQFLLLETTIVTHTRDRGVTEWVRSSE